MLQNWLYKFYKIALGFVSLFLYSLFTLTRKVYSEWDNIPSESRIIKTLGALLKSSIKPNVTYSKNISYQDLEYISTSPVIAVSNHQTGPDPIFLMLALNRPLYFLATDFYNNIPGVKALLNRAKSIMVPSDNLSREIIINETVKRLKQGDSISIFPYGMFHTEITKVKGNKIKIKTGSAEIAIKSQKPIVVMSIKSIPRFLYNNILGAFLFYAFFGKSTVTIQIEKIIKPENFPNTGNEQKDYILLSRIIKDNISTEYHSNPETGTVLQVEKLDINYGENSQDKKDEFIHHEPSFSPRWIPCYQNFAHKVVTEVDLELCTTDSKPNTYKKT